MTVADAKTIGQRGLQFYIPVLADYEQLEPVVLRALRKLAAKGITLKGIGAVDAEFMKKARTRLQDLVARSGILVFASHSNEFLAQLCDTAMWVDHGTIRLTGGIEDVVRAYEGDDAAHHVRTVIEENKRSDTPRG